VGIPAYTAGPELWETVEEFRYEAPGLGWVLGNRGLALVVLALWTTGALLAAAMAVRRAPVA
jgi:hypothetical protein